MRISPDKTQAIVLATHNKGKMKEFASLLAPFKLHVLGLDAFPEVGDVEETGITFEENALLKACTVSRATGLVAVADDSGLEVDALRGEPGVFSARYSEAPGAPATDERNLRKVLKKMQGIPAEQRTGRFRCCMAACVPDGRSIMADGVWEGIMKEQPAGENGFGYDPIFYDPEQGQTAAEMSRELKNSRSHRARAVSSLLEKWPAFWQNWLASQNLST